MITSKITFLPEVESALRTNKPVVALESTLITHGFPQPDNLYTARKIEQAVRDAGAVPATIAILDGRIRVGLNDDQLATLSAAVSPRKCSVRDLPIVMAQNQHGGTTVAATMIIARQAGIQVFATGGIGGIHRADHGSSPWDVSADLMELGRTPITVVCAGMKAFLDLSATLEYLETNAVPVLGYGTSELPAFYSRNSDLAIDMQVDSPDAVAEAIIARDAMQLNNAILVTVPVSAADEWPCEQANIVIERALDEAQAQGIMGKYVTPFLLDRIAVLSEGQSKAANISLLINNARVGAEIASAYTRLKVGERSSTVIA